MAADAGIAEDLKMAGKGDSMNESIYWISADGSMELRQVRDYLIFTQNEALPDGSIKKTRVLVGLPDELVEISAHFDVSDEEFDRAFNFIIDN